MPNSTLTTRSRTVRRAVVTAHLDAVRRGIRTRKGFEQLAEDVKAEIRSLANRQDWNAGRDAQQALRRMADECERAIRDVLRVQSVASYGAAVKSLAIALPAARATVPQPDAEPDDTATPRPSFLGPIGAILALAFVGVMAFRTGNRQGLVSAELAVDQLKTKAGRAVDAHVVAVSNRAVVAAVEAVHEVPVAKQIQYAKRIPVAKLIPVAAQKYPPFILDTPPKETPDRTAPVVKPDRTKPAPGEPEFVILPDPFPFPGYTGERGYLPPTDPNPPSPIRTTPALVGWQVLSMLDDRVRPKHRERHGRVYYYNPRPERGEYGLDDMPNPPYESPKDGGVMAWNCRCVLSPVFEGA